MGNPKLNIFPFEEVSAIASEAKVPLIIDNTAASPAVCRPLEHGANVVVHSLTKFIGGHGTSIGGIVIDGGNFDWGSGRFNEFTEPDNHHGRYWDVFKAFPPAGGANIAYIMKMRLQWLRDTGNCAAPFNSFLHLQGLETLHLRMERHCENAQKVAEFLKDHPQVAWVNYPGLPDSPHYAPAQKYFTEGHKGALVGFGLKGGLEAGSTFIDNLELFSHLANIGDENLWQFIPQPPPTNNSTKHNKSPRWSRRTMFVYPWAVKTPKISLRILSRRSAKSDHRSNVSTCRAGHQSVVGLLVVVEPMKDAIFCRVKSKRCSIGFDL